MEKVTQQTAAGAHDGATASRQLDAQAQALREAVAELRLMVDDSSGRGLKFSGVQTIALLSSALHLGSKQAPSPCAGKPV
jgi:hypothetical protein